MCLIAISQPYHNHIMHIRDCLKTGYPKLDGKKKKTSFSPLDLPSYASEIPYFQTHHISSWFYIPHFLGPAVLSCFMKSMNTIVISTINHSYCRALHQLSHHNYHKSATNIPWHLSVCCFNMVKSHHFPMFSYGFAGEIGIFLWTSYGIVKTVPTCWR